MRNIKGVPLEPILPPSLKFNYKNKVRCLENLIQEEGTCRLCTYSKYEGTSGFRQFSLFSGGDF